MAKSKPEDPDPQPHVTILFRNLKIYRVNPEPQKRRSFMTKIIPAWDDPEFRSYLLNNVAKPALLWIAFGAAIYAISLFSQ